MNWIFEIFYIKLNINLKLLLWWVILILLKIYDKIIEDINKVIFKIIIINEILKSNEKIKVFLENKDNLNKDINKSYKKKNIQFIENILKFYLYIKKLKFIII